MSLRLTFASALLAAATALPAHAASLSVSPIKVEIAAPGNSSTVTVRNEDSRPVTIQFRVFKWSLVKGDDDYQETDDVVVTPPVTTVGPGGAANARIVRTTNSDVAGEETYRLVIDEVPDANRVKNIGVNVAIRYTLPVFFVGPDASQPKMSWSIRSEGGKRVLAATNDGDKHVRLSQLQLGPVSVAKGLAGYVLGHSTKTWTLPASAAGGRVTADSEAGRVDASVGK